jgi:hypothetical protein
VLLEEFLDKFMVRLFAAPVAREQKQQVYALVYQHSLTRYFQSLGNSTVNVNASGWVDGAAMPIPAMWVFLDERVPFIGGKAYRVGDAPLGVRKVLLTQMQVEFQISLVLKSNAGSPGEK